MKRLILLLIVLLISLAGCANEQETGEAEASNENEDTAMTVEDVQEDDVVADIDGHEITGKDLIYEMKRLELISLLQGEAEAEISPAVAIQELVQNHAIHQLASEHEIAVNTKEQEERAKAVRADVEKVDGYEAVMEGIDENLFWSKEENRYEVILTAEMLVEKLMEVEKEEHPNYTAQALQFDAQKELNELIQQQVGEAEVEIYLTQATE